MRNTYDFSPLYRSLVGFDRMASLIDAASQTSATGGSYPPYNVAQLDENAYRIELAVAGFADEDFEIESRENVLTVKAAKTAPKADNDGLTYLHRGIAERGFERRFQLADHVRVTGADLANGMLTITLRREIPEALKPRKIEIGGTAQKRDKKLTAKTSRGKAKAA